MASRMPAKWSGKAARSKHEVAQQFPSRGASGGGEARRWPALALLL
jgi:hypothetical protein